MIKSKNIQKILVMLLIASFLITITTTVLAMVDATFSPDAISPYQRIEGTEEVKRVGNGIIGALQIVGVVISVIMLIIIGIKYMMGSLEEKAEYKKSMIPYIIGAALIFAASAFAQVLYEFFTSIKT